MTITPDAIHDLGDSLRRCEGYTTLHMWSEAWLEIAAVPEELKLTRPVLLTTMQLLMAADSWENATWLGISLLERWPGDLHAQTLTTLCLRHLKVYPVSTTRG